MTGAVATEQWDVFISYSHRDEEWVNGTLCRELLRRYVHGRRPRVFLDTGPDGLQPGTSWPRALAHAVQHSRFFVAVYSADYFASPVCRREMELATIVHADDDRLIPLLLDPSVEVPFEYSPINFLSTDRPAWLERLCDRLGLAGHRDRPQLLFRTPVADVRVDHTLPEQQVELLGHRSELGEEDVTLDSAPTPGLLRGSLTVATSRGVATFRDLSIATPAEGVRLVARYAGGDPVQSAPFSVRGARPRPAGHRGPDAGVWFLGDSRTVATLAGGTLGIAGPGHDRVRFDDVPRLCVRWPDRIAVAGWSGQVAVAATIGSGTTARLGDGLAVPGALCPIGDLLYAGMWSGRVLALDPDGGRPEPVLNHPAGVQAMAAVDGRLLIVGFDGVVAWYAADGTPVPRGPHRLEPVVWGLLVRPDCVIAVGAERVHRLDPAADTVISLRLPVAEAGGTVVGDDLAAVYDRDGHGIRFDAELEVRGAFRSPVGGRPVDMDRAGRVLVTADPDGSYALLVDDRVIHVNRHGPMAIAPDGGSVALVAEAGLRVCPLDDLLRP